MFTTGWAAARRRSACRTADVLALKAHNLDATTFWSAPQISATLPQRHRQFCASSSLTEGTRALDLRLLENGVVEHHLLHPLQESRDCLKTLRRSRAKGCTPLDPQRFSGP